MSSGPQRTPVVKSKEAEDWWDSWIANASFDRQSLDGASSTHTASRENSQEPDTKLVLPFRGTAKE